MRRAKVTVTPGEIACLVEVINRSLLWAGEQVVLAGLIEKLKVLSAPAKRATDAPDTPPSTPNAPAAASTEQ